VRDPNNPDPWYYFANMVYHKGAWVLHMLRHHIGDALFDQCLDNYLGTPELRYGVVVTQNLVDIFSATVGENLDWFFDQWLYWSVHPVYNITRSHATPFDGQVQITVSQLQNPDPVYGDSPFQMPLDLLLHGAGWDSLVTVFNDQRVQVYVVDVPTEITSINLDPHRWLLHAEETFTATWDEPPAPGADVVLLPPVPNPFNPHCTIRWESRVPTRDTLNLYDLQGHRIASSSYDERAAGLREFLWDGRNQHGQPCASGVYLYDITCRGSAPDGSSGKVAPTWRLKGKVTLSK
jgi:hypothetical protein